MMSHCFDWWETCEKQTVLSKWEKCLNECFDTKKQGVGKQLSKINKLISFRFRNLPLKSATSHKHQNHHWMDPSSSLSSSSVRSSTCRKKRIQQQSGLRVLKCIITETLTAATVMDWLLRRSRVSVASWA